MQNEIVLFKEDNIKLEVNVKEETVWLTQAQMANLFKTTIRNIGMHIGNIFLEEELDSDSVKKDYFLTASDGKKYKTKYYNLDMIISVGYRVKSKRGILFRKWANKVLKEYLLKGYAINNKRLESLEKAVKLIDIANRYNETHNYYEIKNILKVIGDYSKALNIIDKYDYKTLSKPNGRNSNKKISYNECLKLISNLKFFKCRRIKKEILNNIFN